MKILNAPPLCQPLILELLIFANLPYSMDMGLGGFWKLVMDREAWYAVVRRVTKSHTRLSDWTELSLPYDSAIPFLGIYPEKSILWKDEGTPMFTAALFTITRTWKQSKCPSTEEWIKKLCYMCTQGCCCLVAKFCPTLCNSMAYTACWAPLSMGFPRQEDWSGLHFLV